jgi:site-specific recombinase XerD
MDAYWAARDGLNKADSKKEPLPREKTFHWLVDQYFRSEEFKRLDGATQKDKRSVLNRFCTTAGALPFSALRKEDVEGSRDKRSSTPAAADKLVKYLRSLFKWALEKNHAKVNPALGVKKINETEGFHTWTPSEIQAYREYYKNGTKARLALEIMLNIGARRSDACRLGLERQKQTEDAKTDCGPLHERAEGRARSNASR